MITWQVLEQKLFEYKWDQLRIDTTIITKSLELFWKRRGMLIEQKLWVREIIFEVKRLGNIIFKLIKKKKKPFNALSQLLIVLGILFGARSCQTGSLHADSFGSLVLKQKKNLVRWIEKEEAVAEKLTLWTTQKRAPPAIFVSFLAKTSETQFENWDKHYLVLLIMWSHFGAFKTDIAGRYHTRTRPSCDSKLLSVHS